MDKTPLTAAQFRKETHRFIEALTKNAKEDARDPEAVIEATAARVRDALFEERDGMPAWEMLGVLAYMVGVAAVHNEKVDHIPSGITIAVVAQLAAPVVVQGRGEKKQ